MLSNLDRTLIAILHWNRIKGVQECAGRLLIYLRPTSFRITLSWQKPWSIAISPSPT